MVDREARRAQRVLLKHPLSVSLRSIGSEVQYELTTTDISDRGFFLAFENPDTGLNYERPDQSIPVDKKSPKYYKGDLWNKVLDREFKELT